MPRARDKGLGLPLATFLVYAYLYAPIAVLAVFSFNRSRLSTHWAGFTSEWYATLWRDEQIFQGLVNSLVVAGVVTLACVAFGTLGALVFGRGRGRGRSLLEGLVYLPLVNPEIVMAVALVIFFRLLRMQLTLRTVMVGNLIQNQFALVRDQPFGSAVAFLLTAVVLLMLLTGLRRAQRVTREMF